MLWTFAPLLLLTICTFILNFSGLIAFRVRLLAGIYLGTFLAVNSKNIYELMLGTPFNLWERRWNGLSGWQRGVVGCLLLIAVSLVATALVLNLPEKYAR
jgi:hypothetical protein